MKKNALCSTLSSNFVHQAPLYSRCNEILQNTRIYIGVDISITYSTQLQNIVLGPILHSFKVPFIIFILPNDLTYLPLSSHQKTPSCMLGEKKTRN